MKIKTTDFNFSIILKKLAIPLTINHSLTRVRRAPKNIKHYETNTNSYKYQK